MEKSDSEKENEEPHGEVDEDRQPERRMIATPLSTSAAALLASNGIAGTLDLLQDQGETLSRLAGLMKGTEDTFGDSVLAASYLSNNLDLSVGAAAQALANSFPDFTTAIGAAISETKPLPSSLEGMSALIHPITEWDGAISALAGIAAPLSALSNFPTPLPTIEMASLLAPLAIERDPSEKIGPLLERELLRPQADIKRELTAIARIDRDPSFNVIGYKFLFELEVILRDLIFDRIFRPCENEKEYANYVDADILTEWKVRKEAEEKDRLIEGEYRIIDYSDFTHLKMILERGKNVNKFRDILNQEQYKGVISRLHELDPIRKKIAHSRLLTHKEFTRLRIHSEDILTLFQKPGVDVW